MHGYVFTFEHRKFSRLYMIYNICGNRVKIRYLVNHEFVRNHASLLNTHVQKLNNRIGHFFTSLIAAISIKMDCVNLLTLPSVI